MKKLVATFFLVVLLAVTAFAQSPPTLRIVTETPNLPSELFYGEIKVKPLRLRPGTNTVITIADYDFFIQQQYIDFLRRFPEPDGLQLAQADPAIAARRPHVELGSGWPSVHLSCHIA
jgi:hypothetical protein